MEAGAVLVAADRASPAASGPKRLAAALAMGQRLLELVASGPLRSRVRTGPPARVVEYRPFPEDILASLRRWMAGCSCRHWQNCRFPEDELRSDG